MPMISMYNGKESTYQYLEKISIKQYRHCGNDDSLTYSIRYCLHMHCKKDVLEVMHNSVTLRKHSNSSIDYSLQANSPKAHTLYMHLTIHALLRRSYYPMPF